MKPHYTDDSVTLYHGDCLDVLAELPDNSVDSVVTDPPYGLEFMGKDWDAPWMQGLGIGEHNAGFSAGAPAVAGVRGAIKSLPSYTGSTNPTCRICGGTRNGNDRKGRKACRCSNPEFPNTTLPRMIGFQDWCEQWARECLRVLKPGGHLLAFGGTRTWHRLACAVEDAGFEIRDNIAWLYGSGFPKSLDVSKAIDKAAGAEREQIGTAPGARNGNGQNVDYGAYGSAADGTYTLTAPATADPKRWAGWGTALKPAFEPVVVARKPLSGTVAGNVLAHGVGALNIDGCRVGFRNASDKATVQNAKWHSVPNSTYGKFERQHNNEVLDGADSTPDAGRWPSNVVIDGHAAAEIDRQSGVSKSNVRSSEDKDQAAATFSLGRNGITPRGHDDEGGASRFFPTFRYQAKAATDERPTANGIAHPTVKPLELMRWLVRLVTPPGGTVLEPFAGSGTTAEACIHEHMRCIAIEREADYLPLIFNRLTKPIEVGFDFGALQ